MKKLKSNARSAAERPLLEESPAPATAPLPDAYTQIRDARDRIVAAVIQHAEAEGSYQHAKWLFEFGNIVRAGHSEPEDEPSLLRILLDRLQLPESPEEVMARLSANDHAVK